MRYFYSPARLTDQINDTIQKLSQSIEKHLQKKNGSLLFFNLAALALAGLYLAYFSFITQNPYLHFSFNPSFFEMRYFWVLPTIIPGIIIVTICLNSLKLDSKFILIILFILAWFSIPYFLANTSYHVLPALSLLAMAFTLVTHVFLLLVTYKAPLNLRLILMGLLEFLLVFFFKRIFTENNFDVSFWLFQPYRYIFIFTILAGEELVTKSRLKFNWHTISFILTPTNFITPLPIKFSMWRVDKSQTQALKAKSLVFLFFGLCMLIFCAGLHQLNHYFLSRSHYLATRWLVGGFIKYLYYFSFSYSNITIPIATLWWLGFNLPDAYNVPLLATTPQDRWRRWNTYFYDWYFRFIFFPILKITRSSFIAVMAAFIATLYIHLGERTVDIFNPFLDTSEIGTKAYRRVLFFLIHGLLVYLGIRFEKYIPSAKSRKGWVPVAFMFLIMSLVHAIFV